jgi:hypothetical protein
LWGNFRLETAGRLSWHWSSSTSRTFFRARTASGQVGWQAFTGWELNPLARDERLPSYYIFFPPSWIYPDARRLRARRHTWRGRDDEVRGELRVWCTKIRATSLYSVGAGTRAHDRALSQRASQKPSRPVSKATAMRVILRPAFSASARHRWSSFKSSFSSAGSFFNGWRSTPGMIPATSQLSLPISITGLFLAQATSPPVVSTTSIPIGGTPDGRRAKNALHYTHLNIMSGRTRLHCIARSARFGSHIVGRSLEL